MGSGDVRRRRRERGESSVYCLSHKQRNMRLSALKVLGALAIFDPVPSALECTENVEH